MIGTPVNEVNDAPEFSGGGHVNFWNFLTIKLTTMPKVGKQISMNFDEY